MQLTAEQERALDAVGRWLARRDRPWFYLAGYAGTGKTTLARHVAETVADRVEFGAPTGKAARVLHRKGCAEATTVHRLIYQVADRSRRRVAELERQLAQERASARANPEAFTSSEVRRLERELREARELANQPSFSVHPDAPLRDAALLVLDEASMVDRRLAEDVLSFGVPVLALGDPAQLPPVRGTGYFTDRRPDALLEDVQRQVAGSPVLDLATRVRRGETLEPGYLRCEGGSDEPAAVARVIRYGELSADVALDADAVLTGHNATRRAWNRRLRELRGFAGDLPRKGERLLVLNNRHDLGLCNGSEVTATSDVVEEGGELWVEVLGEDLAGPLRVRTDRLVFDRYADPKLEDDRPPWTRREAVDLDWAYCLTVHKAQGSEWPGVLVADDGFLRRRPADRRRWLYTAVTRAADRVTVALD